jgi:hypothetical protein
VTYPNMTEAFAAITFKEGWRLATITEPGEQFGRACAVDPEGRIHLLRSTGYDRVEWVSA